MPMSNPLISINRMIQVSNGVIGPIEPKDRTYKLKTLSDYPELSAAYQAVVKLYTTGKLACGIPICDESVALIQHMFTEEEARVVRHFMPGVPQTVKSLAEAEHRPIEEIQKILDLIAVERRVILRRGEGEEAIYMVIPILPGTAELVLTFISMDQITDWHRRFAQLWEALYDTGYIKNLEPMTPPPIKYVAAGQTIKTNPMAFPSDKLEEVYSRYNFFALTQCFCRTSEIINGRGCGKPLEVDILLGPLGQSAVRNGRARSVTMKDALEIKAEAEASGCVTWIEAGVPAIGGGSCSCCGCCCHMMRAVSEFNSPASIAPPHFIPKIDLKKCNHCGKCAIACPMGAVTVDVVNNTYTRNAHRCIGCGQCVLNCKIKALEMVAVPNYEEFQQNKKSLI